MEHDESTYSLQFQASIMHKATADTIKWKQYPSCNKTNKTMFLFVDRQFLLLCGFQTRIT